MKEVKKIEQQREPGATPKWFYIILAFIPILFFILLEIGLRLFSYGNDYQAFVELSPSYQDVLFFNPEIPSKYFTNISSTPSVIPDGFEKTKSKNTFRIFVLGESSAAGWPYIPNASFSRELKRILSLTYPLKKIEVINLGMSAINTYTIRDLIPEVLEQNPDLIIFYNGHNEYYGALGVASSQSLGRSRTLVNIVLALQKFKTVQLVRNIIAWAFQSFSSEAKLRNEGQNETLMGRMIGENLIPYNSSLYKDGLEQFKGNMEEIFEMIKDANIPMLVGTVASNIKDLPPFISIKENNLTNAEEIFLKAKKLLSEGRIEEAKNYFYKAKDYDALRFRAPQKINDIIISLAKLFNVHVVNIDSIFNAKSPHGITGNNLMVDHLHPTFDGYRLMGKAYYNAMEKNNLLPKDDKSFYTENEIDSILIEIFPFTSLDSMIANLKIRILTGSYPFVKKGSLNKLVNEFTPKNIIDSLAIEVVDKWTSWEVAHYRLAERYFNEGDIVKSKKEIDVLIEDRPLNEAPYKQIISMLVDNKLYDDALPYLSKLDQIKSDAFTNKWIGAINLEKQHYKEALFFLQKSLDFSGSDYQVWYNYAGAAYYNGQIEKAVYAIEKSLEIEPRNPQARFLYSQLKQIINYPK
jgi:tetratricopeptide (TPR) repeat protein